jgi:RHS repeat-associated protein
MTADESGAGKTTSYTYDLLGDQTSITYPLPSGASSWTSNDSITYDYDSAGNLTGVTDFSGTTTNIVNSSTGQAQGVSLGSTGDTVVTTYDGDQNPASINLEQDSDGSSLLGFSYSLEPSSAIASETDTPTSSDSPADYGYDAQSQVTSMIPGTDSTLDYGYDASGNLTTLPNGATGTYGDSSELTSSVLSGTTTDYTYNDDGDRTQAEHGGTTTASASYNGADELTSYSDSGGDLTGATYDGDGLRTAITTSSGSESSQSFIWDESSSSPELLMDGTNAYIYGPSGTPIEQVDLSSGTTQYLVADALGSVRGVVSASGSVTASTAYDAWGNPETSGGLTSDTPFGFAGGYTDSTGLVYLINRYYDPETGQFLSVDPDVAQTGEPYEYVSEDPVNLNDPTGDCTNDNVSCWIDNQLHILDIGGSETGAVPVSRAAAEKFLISNGFTQSDADTVVSSFEGPIQLTLATNIQGPIYRYYSGPGKQGNYAGNTFVCTPEEAKIAYYLPAHNTAQHVVQLAANAAFGQDLVLEGAVRKGGPGVIQYIAYNPSEFVYGVGVRTGTTPPPPPISIPSFGFDAA